MLYSVKNTTTIKSISSFILVIAAWLIVNTSSSQDFLLKPGASRPERCVGNADLLYRFCCVIPPFFTRDVAKECGGAFALLFLQHNVTGARRHAFSCQHWYCVLDKYGLIASNGYLDHSKYFSHLDLWVSLNPSFTDVMLDAKVSCKQIYRFFMPLRPCEFSGLNACIRNYIKVECPVTLPTKECNEQKSFFKDCGKYFHKK